MKKVSHSTWLHSKMTNGKDTLEFPTRTEEDGSKSILVKNRMYIRNVYEMRGDLYGRYNGDPCCVTTINGELAVIVIKLANT